MTFIELCECELDRITKDVLSPETDNLVEKGNDCLNTIEENIQSFLKENSSRITNLYEDVKDNEKIYCELRNIEFARTKYFEYIQNIRDIISKRMYDKISNAPLETFIERDEGFIKALYGDDENPLVSLTVKDGFKELDHFPELLKDVYEFRNLITYAGEDTKETTDFIVRLSCISTIRYATRTFKELSEILDTIDSAVNPKEEKEKRSVERYKVFKPEDFQLGDNE